MNSDNLIFSSNIDAEIENCLFDVLLNYFKDDENISIYVDNVILADNELLFFVKLDGIQSIIRIPIKTD